jgi:mRNA-degrading endonuclease YafQ of YafQ-DinJ toxin-antitoxin module
VVRGPQFEKRCSTCFGRQASVFRRHYTSTFWCELRAILAVGWLQAVDFLSILYYTILALHVSDAICTHHQEHKLQSTTVGTRDCYVVLEVA